MNQALYNKMENNFVTVACVFLDLEAGILRYAAAGHPPLILYRKKEHELHEFCDNGFIRGPFPDATYPMMTIPFMSGDRIIMYTDGIIETRNASGELFGNHGFKEFIKDQRDLTPESFVDTLLGHLSAWSGNQATEPLDDDLTLLVIDRI